MPTLVVVVVLFAGARVYPCMCLVHLSQVFKIMTNLNALKLPVKFILLTVFFLSSTSFNAIWWPDGVKEVSQGSVVEAALTGNFSIERQLHSSIWPTVIAFDILFCFGRWTFFFEWKKQRKENAIYFGRSTFTLAEIITFQLNVCLFDFNGKIEHFENEWAKNPFAKVLS